MDGSAQMTEEDGNSGMQQITIFSVSSLLVYTYPIFHNSLRSLNPDKLVSLLLALPSDKQVDILKQLQDKLSDEANLSG